jgi:RNA recognition motif-containing protein
MVNLFIANLDWDITSEDLQATFSAFGPVTYAHVVFDNATKKSKGFGYIEMEETDHGINAINALNGMDINGRKLDVKIASPKSNRPIKKPSSTTKSFEKKPFGDKKPFKKFDKPKTNSGEKKFIKPNPVERDSEGKVIRKTEQ